MRRRILIAVSVCLGLLALTNPASATKFMSIGDAVKRFVPSGAKIVKITKKISGRERQILAEDYGWTPTESKYAFYVGKQGEERVAYVLIVPEIFNTCFHKFAVGMEPDGEIIDTVIVELSCPRALPINTKSFMSQFSGKSYQDPLTTRVDIDGVTGATLSAEAAAIASRKAVSLHNLFFGKAERVALSADVKAGRAAGAGQIQKAIETGETVHPEEKK